MNAEEINTYVRDGCPIPASQKQIDYIKYLADKKNLNLFDEGFRDIKQMYIYEASECIDYLLKAKINFNI